MKRSGAGRKATVLFCLALGLAILLTEKVQVHAAEPFATVQGTILDKTKTNMLYLSTRDGVMEIKLDSDTDASECKALVADKRISVSVAYGSDGYLHAVKITNDSGSSGASISDGSATTVYGTLSKKSKGNLLYFNTAQGVMEIMLDQSTDMSGCALMVPESDYVILCARGSDAYLHALKIADTITALNTGMTASSSISPAPRNPGNVKTATSAVVGKVASNTSERMLYLSTDGGEMQIVIDDDTDTRNGLMLVPGNQLVVSLYRGSDAYLHAVAVVGVKSVSTAVVDTTANTESTVTGTVDAKSTEDILYLNTNVGTMELKMDAVQSVLGCKTLVTGKKLTVVCARGSDAYLHALNITG